MTCKNCNNTLSGTEDYCPFCGTPQKFSDLKITNTEKDENEIPAKTKVSESPIFQSEPVYIYAEPPKAKKDHKTSLATILVSAFLLCLLGIGIHSAAKYFNLTPAFSSLLSTLPTEDTSSPIFESTTEGEFNNSLGLIAPDISLKSTLCVVTSEKGLSLRKGPDNAFAQIDTISNGTILQVIGKSLHNDLWVYVYVSSSDIYGWVSGSYITESSALTDASSAEYTEAETKGE